jgi:hypothetical protein
MNPMVKAGAALSVSLLLISGCSSGKSNSNGEMNQYEQAISILGRAYRDASLGLRRGPANVNELKPYLKKYGDPDKSLVSPNDGQPYQIVWGLMPGRPSRSLMEHPILAYEQTGKNGKRYVLDPMLKVRHLTEKEFTAMQESKPKQGSK